MAEAYFYASKKSEKNKTTSQYNGDVTENDLEAWRLDADICQAINEIAMASSPDSSDNSIQRNSRFMVSTEDTFLAHGCTPPWYLHCHTQAVQASSTSSSNTNSNPNKKLKVCHLPTSLNPAQDSACSSSYQYSFISVNQSPQDPSDQGSSLSPSFVMHSHIPSSAQIFEAPNPLSLGIGLHHYGLVDWSERGIDPCRFPICQQPDPLSICPDPEMHRKQVLLEPLAIACPTCWSGQRRGVYGVTHHNPYRAFYTKLRQKVRFNPQPPSSMVRLMQKYSKLWRLSVKASKGQFSAMVASIDTALDERDRQQAADAKRTTQTPVKSESDDCGALD